MAEYDRKLVLENGDEYLGRAFGGPAGGAVSELVFNTSMAGYQEIVSDPSYTNQTVVMTYPLIGSYGIAEDDFESCVPSLAGLAVREYNDLPSNFRYTRTLAEVLEEYRVPGISGIDTRRLTRTLRDMGTQRALIVDAAMPKAEALALIAGTPVQRGAVASASCKKRWYSRTANPVFNVAAVDCGIKRSIIRSLNQRGCNVTVVPWNTDAGAILAMRPDGVLFSDGPGDPGEVPEVVETVRALRGRLPLMGVCLGHQVICRAYGADTYKLKFGHRGSNHPVRNLKTDRIEITAQNHGYAVDEASLRATPLTLTHRNLLDNTVEGAECAAERVFCAQFHPEGASGLLEAFVEAMRDFKAR
ncbi:MAG: carbamoyl phosphate synthase small subunit [Clostridiales bacterium]|nr:MAG: carbamoyl phosphate synthase small subunit [Clostridiales bacterium]